MKRLQYSTRPAAQFSLPIRGAMYAHTIFSGFLVVPHYGKEPSINHSTLSRVSATVVLLLSSAAVSIALCTLSPVASGSTVNCHAKPHEGVDFAGCNFYGRDLAGAD